MIMMTNDFLIVDAQRSSFLTMPQISLEFRHEFVAFKKRERTRTTNFKSILGSHHYYYTTLAPKYTKKNHFIIKIMVIDK